MGRTSSAVKAKYNKKAYDRIEVTVKKGLKDEYRAACEKAGRSMNAPIGEFIENFIKENS